MSAPSVALNARLTKLTPSWKTALAIVLYLGARFFVPGLTQIYLLLVVIYMRVERFWRHVTFKFVTTACVLTPLVLLVACSGGSASVPAPAYWPTQGWRTSTPEEQGLDSAKLAEGLQAIRDKNINIHSLMMVRNDTVLLDAYFYPYDGKTFHELASVTKSVMTTLIAIAADQGKLRLDQPIVSFFPDRTIANRDARKERITIRHLTGMTSGLDCSGASDEPTLAAMTASPDPIQFTLDLKVVDEPGTHFAYCSPGMHLLSAILQKATGMPTLDFAQKYLFGPLGIREVLWEKDAQGYYDGWAGLLLHPSDAAKIGYLWLHKGEWEGKQIVSRQWVEASAQRQTKTGMGDDYGYGWWVMPGDNGDYAAEGRGGQYIRVMPSINAVVVTTGGGFQWTDVTPMLTNAVVDTTRAIPANAAGNVKLNNVLAAVRQAPAPQPVPPLPETARSISGKTFVFQPNPLGFKTVRWEFDDSAEARIQVTTTNNPTLQLLPIGLDGVYRMSASDYDLPQGMRGRWLDSQTLLVENDRIANLDAYTLKAHFEGDRVTIDAHERTHQDTIRIEGKRHSP